MDNKYLQISRTVILLCLAALGLMYIAFYNGYPLMDPDTAAYIDVGFHMHMPADRPPFYGVFIRGTSLWTSLWFPVFVQSLMVTFLLFRLASVVFGKYAPRNIYITAFLIIISFTSVSWVTSYLMSDIFVAILTLAILLYLYPDTPPANAAVYLLIIAISILMHNSHFIIAILFSVCLIITAIIKRAKVLVRKATLLFAVSVSCYLMVCSINLYSTHEFTFSKGSHVFMMGKLAETGILNTYLDDNCEIKKYELCNYKNEIPIVAFAFLWDGNSPLYKTGGWDSSKLEYDSIIQDVFTTPKYLQMFALRSAISTTRQLTQINIAEKIPPQGSDSGPFGRVHHYFQDEEKEYLLSRQNRNVFETGSLNVVYEMFFILSSIFVLWYLPRIPDRRSVTTIYTTLILLIVLNAFTTATLANVLGRLQIRVFWLLPALNAMMITRYFYERTGWKNQRPTEKL